MTQAPERLICFSHGMLSRPQGTKINALTEVAHARGYKTIAPDYTSTTDPDERVEMLLKLAPKATSQLILVGSSMGAYVSLVAAPSLQPQGLFLLAPAVGMPGYAEPAPAVDIPHLALVHGWSDEVIPVDNAIAWGRTHKAQTYLVDGDHRLLDALPQICQWFGDFLERMA